MVDGKKKKKYESEVSYFRTIEEGREKRRRPMPYIL